MRSDAVRRGAFARLEKMNLPVGDPYEVLHPQTDQQPASPMTGLDEEPSIFDGPWGWILRGGLYLGGALLGYGIVRGALMMYARLTNSIPAITAVPSDPLEAVVTGAVPPTSSPALLERARALLSRPKAG